MCRFAAFKTPITHAHAFRVGSTAPQFVGYDARGNDWSELLVSLIRHACCIVMLVFQHRLWELFARHTTMTLIVLYLFYSQVSTVVSLGSSDGRLSAYYLEIHVLRTTVLCCDRYGMMNWRRRRTLPFRWENGTLAAAAALCGQSVRGGRIHVTCCF